ncbi:MAG: sulfatase-like hydrolase/transferase [Gammaproteobacteria bacterium]
MIDLRSKWQQISFLYILFHIIMPLFYSLVLNQWFGYSYKIIPLHFLHFWFYFSIIITSAIFVHHFFNKTVRNIYNAIVFSGFDVFILSIYCLNLISNSSWGSNVNLGFVVELPFHLQGVAEAFNVPVSLIYLPAILILIALIYSYYRYGSIIIGDCHQSIINKNYTFKKKTIAYYLALTSFAIFFFNISLEDKRIGIWTGEPLAYLYINSRTEFLSDPVRIAERTKDMRLRQQYLSNNAVSNLSSKPNIILIIADALRKDHMSVYNYERATTPFLTSLDNSSKLKKVEFATSSCSESLCGIVSVLSSREYQYLSYDLFKLNDLLRDQGYHIEFLLSSSHYFLGKKKLYGPNIDRYVDGTHFQNYTVYDDRGVIEALENTDVYSGKPVFFYFHLMSSHQLGNKLSQFNQFNAVEPIEKYNLKKGSRERYQSEVNNYDLGVLQTDDFIKKIFSMLTQKKYLDNALVIITGDHGDGLGERGNYSHTQYLFQEDISIPLLIYDTNNTQYSNLEFSTHIDIAPTIVERVGLPVPESWHGKSLLDPLRIPRFTNHQTNWEVRWKAIIMKSNNAIYKYIKLDKKYTGKEIEMLYELISDPDEKLNLIQHPPEDILNLLRNEYYKSFH